VSKNLAEENGIAILETIVELDLTIAKLHSIFLPLLELLASFPSTHQRKVRLLRGKITMNELLLDDIVRLVERMDLDNNGIKALHTVASFLLAAMRTDADFAKDRIVHTWSMSLNKIGSRLPDTPKNVSTKMILKVRISWTLANLLRIHIHTGFAEPRKYCDRPHRDFADAERTDCSKRGGV
jgi:hypothetical protein